MSVDARLHVRATRCAGHHRTPVLDQAAVERPGVGALIGGAVPYRE
jgi:hypothetical protein